MEPGDADFEAVDAEGDEVFGAVVSGDVAAMTCMSGRAIV